VFCSGVGFFLLRKQNFRLISWKALRPMYQSIRSHHAMCLMSAKTGRLNRGFKSVPKCRSTFVFCAPVILYKLQQFDRLIFCPRSPTDFYKQSYKAGQISINKVIEPDSDIIWDILSCTAPKDTNCQMQVHEVRIRIHSRSFGRKT